jgi:GNAT superfamily N-acetyltransferase
MGERDLAESRRIFRLAFGTFIGLPNPERFASDQEYILTRWCLDPSLCLVAELNGAIAGSNFVTHWGSFGFFGPLTVRPDLWERGVAKQLLGPTMDLLESRGVRQAGLYTFANSPKHVALYQKFGFWPRFLTAVMSKPVEARGGPFSRYSALNAAEQEETLRACRALTGSIYDGLDVTGEIRSVQEQKLGDTVLLWGGDSLDGFALCQFGEGTEAGPNTCYIKFGAVKSGVGAEDRFGHLLDACEAFASDRGMQRVQPGVNLARSEAYRQMLRRGFRTVMQGVAMHRPDSPAYNRADAFVIDDWR